MRHLSLRARVLLGVGLLTVVQVVAAVALISETSNQLLDQIDDRLAAAAATVPTGVLSLDASRPPVDGAGDVYQAALMPDGSLLTLNPVSGFRGALPPPAVRVSDIAAALAGPITVEAQSSELEYRLRAVESDSGQTLVLATELGGYEFTLNRLIRLVTIGAAIMLLVIGAVTWWVLRLGIKPIKKMTSTAESIAAGRLSERIQDAQPGTEAGQLGLALNAMMGRIETSFEDRTRTEARLRQFLADASHELRTPVATIRGYAELYEAGGLAHGPDLDDAMRRTRQESERMSRLVADMLHLAKLDRDPELILAPVDLDALARDIVIDATTTHEHRTIKIESVSGAIAAGDEDLLRQAVANLVSNALVHTEASATVTVTVAVRDGNVVVSVADDGDGMSQDVVARVTERFFRADSSRSRAQGGSGLGLAIVASIVEAHDGALQIDSAVGHGSTFTISLPAGSPPASKDHTMNSGERATELPQQLSDAT